MRRSQADSTNRSLAAFGKLQHIRLTPRVPPAETGRGYTAEIAQDFDDRGGV